MTTKNRPTASNTSLPKYCLHRASGQAYVKIKGQFIYLGPYKSKASRLEYDRIISEYLASGRQLPATRVENTLGITELCVRYLKFVKQYYVKDGEFTSEVRTITSVLRPLRRTYGHTPVSEFGPLALKAVREKWIQKKLSRGTINQHVGRILRMFRWAVSEELIDSEVYQRLKSVPGLRRGRSAATETQPIKPIAQSVIDATLPHLGSVIRDMVKIQLLTGMRPNEICNLRPSDIDTTHDEVWRFEPHRHKTQHHGRRRVIFIGPKARQVLKPYMKRSPFEWCFSPKESVEIRSADLRANRRSKVQPSQQNRRKKDPKTQPSDQYTTDSYRRAIHRACERAEIEKWNPNRLRHSAATTIRREFGLDAAQTVLGHSNAKITEVYAELDYQKAISVMEKIG